MSIASLSMYDFPALRGAIDTLWTGLARAMRAEGIAHVPDRLDRSRPFREQWLDPYLLFAQTCGYPLTHQMAGRVQLVATPIYVTPEGPSAHYCSVFLVREADPAADLVDLRGRRVVVNAADSQSGYSALRHALAPLANGTAWFSEVATSGSHLNSMVLLQQGQGDLCSVDLITYLLAQRAQPEAVAGLRILGQSEKAPNLPYITRITFDDETVARLRNAVAAAMVAPDGQSARDDLLLAGVEFLPLSAYDRILDMEAEAEAQGYPQII